MKLLLRSHLRRGSSVQTSLVLRKKVRNAASVRYSLRTEARPPGGIGSRRTVTLIIYQKSS
jgi:hypothetical protein